MSEGTHRSQGQGGSGADSATIFDKCHDLTNQEKADANKALKILGGYKNPVDGIAALQEHGHRRRETARRDTAKTNDLPLDPAVRSSEAHSFAFSRDENSCSDLDLIGNVNIDGKWQSRQFFAVACLKAHSILTTRFDGATMVALCDIEALPESTRSFLSGSGNESHNASLNFISVALEGYPCTRDGADAIYLRDGAFNHRCVDAVMWKRIQKGHIQSAKLGSSKGTYRCAVLNFDEGKELSSSQLVPIDNRGIVRRATARDAALILGIAQHASTIASATFKTKQELLNYLENISRNGARIEKVHRMIQHALGGDPQMLPSTGRVLPCRTQQARHDLQKKLSDKPPYTWSLTPCACDIELKVGPRSILGESAWKRGGRYPHDEGLERSKQSRRTSRKKRTY